MKTLALRACRPVLGQIGYDVVRRPDTRAASTVKDAQYYTQWSAPSPLFTPWVGHPEFQALYEGVAPHTIVPPERCYILAGLAGYAKHIPGAFAECGVFKGGTALLLSRIMKGAGKRLFLFDSFQGLPELDPDKDKWFRPGQYSSGAEIVTRLLSDFADFVTIREGWIPQTFIGLDDTRYAFAHIDVDLYRSTLDCCEHFYPRLAPGGVLLFDEYGFASARGERDAVDEFFSDKVESPITLPTGQAIVLKLPPR